MEKVELIVDFALLVHMPHPLELMDHALFAQLALQILVIIAIAPLLAQHVLLELSHMQD